MTKHHLENCYPLDGKRLLGFTADGGLGYRTSEISYTFRQLEPFLDIDLKPGEIIIIALATGALGGPAVEVALAMGAPFIAAGRNADSLKRLTAINERAVTLTLKH